MTSSFISPEPQLIPQATTARPVPRAAARASTPDGRRGLGAVADYATQLLAVTDTELRKLRHDPMELVTRAIQPALWLILFGTVMGRVRGLSTISGIRYIDFLAPGILSQSVLFAAIFYGISVIWERDLGILQRYLVSAAPRSTFVLGKALSSPVRGLVQAVIVYVIASAMGIALSLNPLNLLAVAVFIGIGSALFSTFSLVVACLVKTRERFMGIGQVITMPIFFASNAIYPIHLMPHWLQIVSRLNPLTYEADALRAFMLKGGVSTLGIGMDFAVLMVTFSFFAWCAVRLCPRMAA